MRNNNDNNDNDDNISNLIYKKLQDICRLHSSSRGGVKSGLITRITNHLNMVAPLTIDNE